MRRTTKLALSGCAAVLAAGALVPYAFADDPEYVWTHAFGGAAGEDVAFGVGAYGYADVFATGRFKGEVDFNPDGGGDVHTSNGNWDVFATKLGNDGSYRWTGTVGGQYWDHAYGVAVAADGAIALTGRFNGVVDFDPTGGVDEHESMGRSYDIFLSKWNGDGSYGWTRTFGGPETDEGYGVAFDAAGNVFVVGVFRDTVDFNPGPGEDPHTSNGNEDVFITKFGIDGTYGWTRTIGGFIYDYAYDAAVDPSGGVIVGGQFERTVDFDPTEGEDFRESKGKSDVFVLRLGADGSYGWAYTVGGTKADRAYGVAADENGNVVATGAFRDTVDFNPDGGDPQRSRGDFDVFVALLGIDGSYVWARSFGASFGDMGNGIALDPAGTVVLTGQFQMTVDFDPGPGVDERTSNGGADVFATALNLDGTYGWTYAFGGERNDRGQAVAVDNAGGAIVAGSFQDRVDFDPNGPGDVRISNGADDVFVTKIHYEPVGTPGACCVDVECFFVTQAECAAMEGEFKGPGVTCEEVWCGGGACCVGPECHFIREQECIDLNGQFQGPDVQCEPDTCGAGPADTWHTFQHDARRSGQSDAIVPDSPVLLWQLLIGEDPSVVAPTVGPDGVIYVSAAQRFGAVEPDGDLRWYVNMDVRAEPLIRADGLFFVNQSKYDPDGPTQVCSGAPGGGITAALDPSGNVYGFAQGFESYPWSVRKAGPGCDEIWRYGGEGDIPVSPPAIGPDGGVYVTKSDAFLKLNGDDGSEEWVVDTPLPPGDIAVGPDGTVYQTFPALTCPRGEVCDVETGLCPDGINECWPSELLATDPDGNENWRLEFGDTVFEAGLVSPAVAGEGTIYAVGEYEHVDPHDAAVVAVSPDGDELWSYVEPGGIRGLSPVIDGEGTVLFPTRVGQIIALSPETGLEKWRVDVGAEFKEEFAIKDGDGRCQAVDENEPPASDTIVIEHEGTVLGVNIHIVVPHERVGDVRITLEHGDVEVVVIDQVCGDFANFMDTTLDDEGELNFVEDCRDGFVGVYQPSNPLSEFDEMRAEGEWTIWIEDLEPGNIGVFENWQLEIRVLTDERDDYLFASPAIAEDGTFYVSTFKGYLQAFGNGCPKEPDPTPPYGFHRVCEEGQTIGDFRVQRFESFNIGTDGRVTFQARISGPGERASFIEQHDGSLKPYGRKTLLDEHLLDDASLALIDDEGATYMPAVIVEEGPAVFVNDELYLSEPPRPIELAPVILHEFAGSFFDIDQGGNFLLFGKEEENDPYSVLRIDPVSQRVDSILSVGTRVDELGTFNFEKHPSHRRQANSFGSYVVAGEKGVVVDGRVVIRRGERVGQHRVFDCDYPQIIDDGRFYFWADHGNGQGVFDATGRMVGTGDQIGDFQISTIERYEVDNTGKIAFASRLLDGSYGVFRDDKVVAVAGATQIEGALVEEVYTGTLVHNNAGQVGFSASVDGTKGVYVATPTGEPGRPFDYRKVIEQGDPVRGDDPLSDVHELDLADSGLIAGRVQAEHVINIAPMRVHTFGDTSNFYVTDVNSFMIGARIGELDPLKLSIVDVDNQELTAYFGVGDVIDGFEITSIHSGTYEQRLVNDSGQIVAAALDDTQGQILAIVSQDEIVARTGDRIGDAEILTVSRPEINDEGTIIFRAEFNPQLAPIRVHEYDDDANFFGTDAGLFMIDVRVRENDPFKLSTVDVGTQELTPQFGVGDIIDDFQITSIVSGEHEERPVDNNGKIVAACADQTGPTVTAILTKDEALVRSGDEVDGYTLKDVTRPEVTDEGRVVFHASYDDVKLAPIRVYQIFEETDFYVADSGLFMVNARIGEGDPGRLSVVDTQTKEITPHFGVGDVIGRFTITMIISGRDEQRLISDAGTIVAACVDRTKNDVYAIVTKDEILTKTGRSIGGYELVRLTRPEITGSGKVIFRGTFDLNGDSGSGIFDLDSRLIGTGDDLGDATVTQVYVASINENGQLAVTLERSDQHYAVYLDDKPVAIEHISELGGETVQEVDVGRVAVNADGRVAFVARAGQGADALWIATPTGQPDPPFEYRKVAEIGDTIGGHTLHELSKFRLTHDGRVTVYARSDGPDVDKIFVETAKGVFDAWAAGDGLYGFEAMGFGNVPHIDSSGRLYLTAALRGIGQVVFVDGVPILQERCAGGSADGIFDLDSRLIGTGDHLGDGTVARTFGASVNEKGQLAVTLERFDDLNAVYLDGSPVAVEGITEINGEFVVEVATAKVRLNQEGQVAILARAGDGALALWIATPTGVPEPRFDYRKVAEVGEQIGGHSIHALSNFRLTDTGLVTFYAKENGPDADKIFIETAEGVFDAYAAGDRLFGYEVLKFGTVPHVDSSGRVFITVHLRRIGQVVFVDGEAIVQGRYSGETRNGILSRESRLISDGDDLGDATVRQVYRASINNGGQLATALERSDMNDAVYMDGKPVIIELLMELEGETVYAINQELVRLNEAGQVGFIARSGPGNDTVWIATPTGVPEPPFAYRKVAEVGDEIGGTALHAIDNFQLTESGLVTMFAKRDGDQQPSKIFVETAEGAFDAWTSDDELYGYEVQRFGTIPYVDTSGRLFINANLVGVGPVVFVDGVPVIQSSVFADTEAQIVETSEGVFDAIYDHDVVEGLEIRLGSNLSPRVDDDGNVYNYVDTTEVGPTLLRNRQLLVQADVQGATAPVLLEYWPFPAKMFDVTDGDHVLLYGRTEPGPANHLLMIDAVGHQAAQVFKDGQEFPGWVIEHIETGPLDERHIDRSTRTFVVSGEQRRGVTIDENIYARDGTVVDGKALDGFSSPQVDGGDPVFIAEFTDGTGIFDAQRKYVATGDVIEGHTIRDIVAHSMTDGVSAFSAELADGRVGIFRGDGVIAVEGVTEIEGEVIDRIVPEVVRKNENGEVAFAAGTVGGRLAALVASGPNGGITFRRAATVGDSLGGLEYDFASGQVHCPREDSAGIRYQSVAVSGGSQTVFQNDRPLIQEAGSHAVAPIQLYELDPMLFGVGDDEHLVVAGKVDELEEYAVILVDQRRGTLESVVQIGQKIQGAGKIASIHFSPTDQRHVGKRDDVAFVVTSSKDGIQAVMNRTGTLIKTGDQIAGYTVHTFDLPQVGDHGEFTFWASTSHPQFGQGEGAFLMADTRVVGTGDVIEEYVILTVDTFAAHDGNSAAFVGTVEIDQGPEARGALTTDCAVAVEGVTEIDGRLVVAIDPLTVRFNKAEQVAFIAEVEGSSPSLYVATEDENEGYVFRLVASVGDVIEGAQVESFDDFRLSEDGLARFVSLDNSPAQFVETGEGVFDVFLSGQVVGSRQVVSIDDLRLDDLGLISFRSGDAPETTTLFREQQRDVFGTVIDGDRIQGLRIDLTLGRPFAARVELSGGNIMNVPVAPVGPLVFVNRESIAHAAYRPPSVAPVNIDRFDLDDYVDHDESGRFLVFGAISEQDPPGLLSVDSKNGSVTTLLSVGDNVEDLRIESIEPAQVNGYADDGIAVMRVNEGTLPAIVTQTTILVETGDEVNGEIVSGLSMPRRTADGMVYYRANGFVFRQPLEGPGVKVLDWLQTVAGQPLLSINSCAVNNAGDLAYLAKLPRQRGGVFTNDDPVAIDKVTKIDDRKVLAVGNGSQPHSIQVSINEYGQVAFVARVEGRPTALYVATPLSPWDYNGDCYIDLEDYTEFNDCLSGPGETMKPECWMFDINDDCCCDMRDFQLFQREFTGSDDPIENCRPAGGGW